MRTFPGRANVIPKIYDINYMIVFSAEGGKNSMTTSFYKLIEQFQLLVLIKKIKNERMIFINYWPYFVTLKHIFIM